MFFPASRCSLWRTEPHCFLLLLATSPAPVRTFQYSISFKLLFYLVQQMPWFPSGISLQIQYSFATTTSTLDVIQSLSHFSTTDPGQILVCINRDNQKRKNEFAELVQGKAISRSLGRYWLSLPEIALSECTAQSFSVTDKFVLLVKVEYWPSPWSLMQIPATSTALQVIPAPTARPFLLLACSLHWGIFHRRSQGYRCVYLLCYSLMYWSENTL